MFDDQSGTSDLVYSVSDLNAYIRALLESNENLINIWVEGEVSNLSQPRSGHIYFTLKDENASVRCVIWRTHASRLAGALRDGMRVEARGSVSVYEGGGQYQLDIDGIRAAGEGRLYQEFLRLKEKLAAEGLFDENRKRPIPSHPKIVGIVTSPTGAALQDMLNTLRMRYPMTEVILSPAMVQGEAAPSQIVNALNRLNHFIHPDVILIGRGGGSLEDLWAFNDEQVARAVAASEAPVISGVGHETDFTLTDLAADLRAPTPTGAAVFAVPDIADVQTNLSGLKVLFNQTMENYLDECALELREKNNRLANLSPSWLIKERMQRLDNYSLKTDHLIEQYFSQRHQRLELAKEKLTSFNPHNILKRGFALVEDKDGAVITSIQQVQLGQDVTVHVSNGSIFADVSGIKKKE
ncbi:MAG: exodeoxyribonuclease VII large subunit [Pelolinea sp.]|nr:exodeoxyribonuclease VII large subunit [Pelolinea sp.]